MIEYLIMDVDGSLTDGKIYMGDNGELMKAFSIKDGYVFKYILKPLNIKPIVITARNSEIVKKRCEELGISDIYQGRIDKFKTLREVIGEDKLGKCAYFGDDIIDLKCIIPIKEHGGMIGCPADAVTELKGIADYVCVENAGCGALREFVEWLINCKQQTYNLSKKIEFAMSYLKELDVSSLKINSKIIVNDDFFYSVQSYYTKDENLCDLESHRKYVDIQLLLKGEEYMDVCDISRLQTRKSYDINRDIMLWNIPKRMMRIAMSPNDYIILYPENAHRGTIKVKEEPSQVIKVVGKVKI